MRQLALRASLIGALAVAAGHAQDTDQRFRARVDLIAVDVAAHDSRGRPVDDLRVADFTVKVDGKVRPVVSAELIKVDKTPPPPARPADALIATNRVSPAARRIIIGVDQTLITPGSIQPLLRTASQFVERLTPEDHVAFVAFPEPGPRVDFTTDKARVQKVLATIIGQPARIETRLAGIALWEALTITGGESIQNKTVDQPPGPTMRRVMERLCGQELGVSGDDCRRLIYNESVMLIADARQDAQVSLRALEGVLRDLVPLDGPKTMVVFSAGIVNDDPAQLDGVADLAAEARTTINVIAVDRDRDQLVRNNAIGATTLSLVDRSIEMQGLELIADRTGGSLFRGIASGAGIFDRLESELSGWYLVAVERQPGDPERQRIEVAVKRKGVAVRAKEVVIARRLPPLDDALNQALASPFALAGIPIRLSTFTQRDAAEGNYKLLLAAQVGQPGASSGEFAVGYILADERDRVVTSAGARRTLSALARGPNQLLHYDTALSAAPGAYSLRFAVVDGEGRRGTVVHRIELPKVAPDEITTSDLIVGNLPAEGAVLRPTVEPQVTGGPLAGYLEVYLPDTAHEGVSVTLDIAEGDASPPLATETLALDPGEQPSWRVAAGVVDVTVAPGRYVARATVRRDGKVVRTLSRPITVVRDLAVAAKARPRSGGVPVSPELQQRTAAYVVGVVSGLANVVAQEEFVLKRPDRRVTSDLLLVRYPGSQRDLIPYRDVAQVDGKVVPGREERLLELFVKPTPLLRERARQIMAGADAFVPSALNPIFVLGFLQPDFQSRFQMTVNDAGPEWPGEVKAVSFVETGRRTLLRTGPFGDIDVATRGTAWIEEATGRILQTELQIGTGRSAPTMVTRFKVDDRLQVAVPESMRTQNPEGVATYTNYRRFAVETDALIPAPTQPER